MRATPRFRLALVGSVLGAVITAACLGGGARRPAVSAPPPPLSPAEAALRGQWELVSVDAQGRTVPASGRLAYDEFNNISVRAELQPGTSDVTPPRVVLMDFQAKAVLRGGEIAYVGLERRSPPEQMIPTASEPSAWRHYAIEGDTLRIWQVNEQGQPFGTMVFRRLP